MLLTDMQRTLQAEKYFTTLGLMIWALKRNTYKDTDITEQGFGRFVKNVGDFVLEVLRGDYGTWAIVHSLR